MQNKHGNKRRLSAAALGGHQHKKGRKENGFEISDISWYYSTDEWNKL